MSNAFKHSSETIATEDYISTTLAATRLEEILKDEALEPEIKNRILEKYSSFVEEFSRNNYLIKDLSLAVFSSLEEIKIIVSDGVKIEFYEETNDLIEEVDLEAHINEEIAPQLDIWSAQSAHAESPTLPQPMKKRLTFTTEKCQNPHDPTCIGTRTIRIPM